VDQRRLFLFLTLCFLLLIAFGPKAQPPKKPVAGGEAQLAQADELAKANDEASKAQSATDSPGDASAASGDNAGNNDGQPLAEVESELEYVTLGSLDPNSAYRQLVTLTNQGAGVRRIELSSPRFRDLHDPSGYLGHLELTAADEGGLRIQSLGAGTPAAEAGLEIGDRIVAFTTDEGPVAASSSDEFMAWLGTQKPRQEITLQVAPADGAAVDRTIALRRRPLEVIRPEAENVLMRTDTLPAGVTSPPSFQFTFEQLGTDKIPASAQEIVGLGLRDSNWEITAKTENSVTFRKRVPKYQLEIEKTYRLEAIPQDEVQNKDYPGYDLTLNVKVRNLGEETLPLRYQLDGPNGLPVEGWWYANKIGREWTVGIRDVIARHVTAEKAVPEQFGAKLIADGEAEVMQGNPLAYAGVDAQYFSGILLPEKPSLETAWIDELRSISLSPPPDTRPIDARYANVTCRLVSHEQQLAAGETMEHTYDIFAGPKRPELLEKYAAGESTQYDLRDLSYYGWFSPVSKAMLAVLHFFYGIFGNYGIAIILLTVLVRSCLFPISRKQAQSMAKMQELRPEMDKLKEKYKQDMQKQSAAMQELYRKHNINPLAGCLPMFIQLPIFLGLYRALMVDVELRQAPLLSESIRWCSNLASPDMFYDWSSFMPDFITSGEGIFGLGPYLNILPLITVALFMLQQKMFMPEPANEQAAMQQKIMKYMMLFMGLMFFKVASGLCLYFIASSIWGIAERKMLPKPPTAPELATASGPTPPTSSSQKYNADRAATKRAKKSKKKKR